MDGLDSMLENGSWFICNNPLILKKWNPNVDLLKEDVVNVSVWVKLHGVPMIAFSEDGLSVVATKLGTLLILDLCTSDMCMESWVRSSYVRAIIKLRDDVDLKDTIMDECPKNTGSDVVKNLKKPSQAPKGVSVGPKVGFKPAKQVYRQVSKKNNINTSGKKKKDVEANSSGSSFWNTESSSISTTPIVEKIDKLEKLIIDGKIKLVDDEGKPLKKVDYLGDHDSEDEVAP
ncbi:stigma-specific STIG1 family protein [Tanacetum coccineum]